ncbi:DNA topoisomerase IB [Borborobacter arsenicus]|nr:DNA topoisomerase IB [Pseudaminobacter arsenicus]
MLMTRSAPVGARTKHSLTYGSDTEPGILRRRAGRGFYYADAKGIRVGDQVILDRIKKLAIPPAWENVWISSDPKGHLQATGRDQRGRKQYRYHPEWTAHRDGLKYTSLIDFAHALPRLRQRIDADLRRRGLCSERVLASIVWLLDNAMIRIGSESYARDNGSFGLTTLRDRHVDVSGSTLRFAFRGKSGKEWKLRISDRRIANIVKSVQELPGQQLFQYSDDEGQRRTIASQDVNDYIRSASNADFSSRHFRTWGGTVTAARLFAETARPDTKSGMARAANSVIDQVAARLRNTRAVCRQCYIHPLILSAWNQGRLAEELASVRSRMRKRPQWLDLDEAVVLRWLEQANGAASSPA